MDVPATKIKILLAFLTLTLFSISAHAVPTLIFNGSVSYSQAQNTMLVDAVIVDFQDIAATTGLMGSSFQFNTSLNSVISDSGFTTGVFDSSSASITNNGSDLLSGALVGLTMIGLDGFNLGSLYAEVMPDSGILLPEFTNPSDLLALQLNMTSVFGPDLFLSDFNAQVNGTLTSATPVPEPSTLGLLGIVLLGLAVRAKIAKGANKKDTV